MCMKRTPADDAFSKCTRERADWTCELCGTVHVDAQAKGASKGLDCSHLFGRGNWSVRVDPNNSFCHCTACHFRFGADRQLQRQHHEAVFGSGMYEIIEERKNDTSLGRRVKREQKEIAKHYRQEYERMRGLRKQGITGRIEFVGYF